MNQTPADAREKGSQGERSGRLRVYVAGKMMFMNAPERDWRGLLRFPELEWTPGTSMLERLHQLRDLELEWDDHWTYVGPHFLHHPQQQQQHEDVDYFYQLDDDTRSVGVLAAVLPQEDQRETTMDEREKQALLDNARHQIAKCDVLYARLPDHKDAYFTLVEIGLAAALGCRLHLAACPLALVC